MRGLIKNVAGVIGDLQTLNLLEEKNVTTTIELNEQTAVHTERNSCWNSRCCGTMSGNVPELQKRWLRDEH